MGACFTTVKDSYTNTYTNTYIPLRETPSPTYSKYNVNVQKNSHEYYDIPLNDNIPPIYCPPPT